VSVDQPNGHLVVTITDSDSYGRSRFVESLATAVVSALAEEFPGRRVDVERSPGISPLGPCGRGGSSLGRYRRGQPLRPGQGELPMVVSTTGQKTSG
jgi:hypothetical protein